MIGIIDTGIFQGNSEFAGRISSASTDIFSTRGTLEGEDDHGTLVAMIAAGANDGTGTVGMAYDATILAIRADDPGSCASVDDCTFSDLGDAIDYAIDHNVSVINMSLGGSGASTAETNAVARAAAAGIVVVVSSGNDGATRPDGFARSLAAAGNGNVIIVGSVDGSGTISDFSNKARGSTQYFLTALGERVTVYLNGPQWSEPPCQSPTLCLISGTSFSAPQVSGAVALLVQAFPTLTAPEIVELLLTSAQDVGAAGVDDIYGYGILDIYEAFQPQGLTALAGGGGAIPLTDTSAVGSPAMGDALSTASLPTVVLDKYRRAYNTNLGYTMRSASVSRRLQGAVGAQSRFVSVNAGKASLAFTIDTSGQAAGLDAASQLKLSTKDAEAARVQAARIAMQISPRTQIGLAYAESPVGLVAQLQGQDRPAFLIAPQASGDDGAFRSTDVSFALRRKFGLWGLTLSGESGEVVSGAPLDLVGQGEAYRRRDAARGLGLALDRDFGSVDSALGINWVSEDRTVLGARFHDAFGAGGAQSIFVDASAGWNIGGSWHLGAALRNGLTMAEQGSVISGGSQIYSRAWSLDLERSGVFGAADALGFRIAQPLRVESGGLKLYLPVAYSYDTLAATYGIRPLSLAPEGREIMGELAWRGPLWGGNASTSLFYRRDPGHYANLTDDRGIALRWSKRF